MKRGPRSHAELSIVVDHARGLPPSPPEELTPSQAETWREIMASVPSGYILPAAYHVLVDLCRHVDRSRVLELLIEQYMAGDKTVKRHYSFGQLLSLADREGRSIGLASKVLRLTPRSVHPVTAARRLNNHVQDEVRPWREMGLNG